MSIKEYKLRSLADKIEEKAKQTDEENVEALEIKVSTIKARKPRRPRRLNK